MDFQIAIVFVIIVAAFGYAGRSFRKRTRSFSKCGNDCGCGTGESKN